MIEINTNTETKTTETALAVDCTRFKIVVINDIVKGFYMYHDGIEIELDLNRYSDLFTNEHTFSPDFKTFLKQYNDYINEKNKKKLLEEIITKLQNK